MLKTMLSEHLCLWITLPQNMCFGKRCYCKLKQSDHHNGDQIFFNKRLTSKPLLIVKQNFCWDLERFV